MVGGWMASSCWQVLHGLAAHEGEGLGEARGLSLACCQAMCSEHSRCNSISYLAVSNGDHECYLKARTHGASASTHSSYTAYYLDQTCTAPDANGTLACEQHQAARGHAQFVFGEYDSLFFFVGLGGLCLLVCVSFAFGLYWRILRATRRVGNTPSVDEFEVATVARLRALPTHVLESSHTAADGSIVECALCMEELATGDEMRVLPCMHSFHRTCIDRWFIVGQSNQVRKCPLCKANALAPPTPRPSDTARSSSSLPAPHDDRIAQTSTSPVGSAVVDAWDAWAQADTRSRRERTDVRGSSSRSARARGPHESTDDGLAV